jgi:RNA polymerase sigma factor (TIGR02999 family)
VIFFRSSSSQVLVERLGNLVQMNVSVRWKVCWRDKLQPPVPADGSGSRLRCHRLRGYWELSRILPGMLQPMSDVTRLLDAVVAGDRKAAADLLPLVYNELRVLAAARMSDESPDQTLQPTALVHEAYLRLIGPTDETRWENRGHFFAAAAEAMRRILVDAARRKRTEKHGGGRQRVELPDVPANPEIGDEQLLALDAALTRLAAEDPVAARVVELRHFAGLSIEDAATALGMSRATAYRHWTYARAWLRDAVTGAESG